ncbi:uncharacterized protein I206_101293 [Kwoniella pini CBS 10737]|uniref:Uncharacterized protein n=1 Tax=Kwoniella pini CBS 10737 TaxID=1296096 RepID=A0A1B9IB98_9TREE|nr:uncharacterized protein I206_00030 [Kwoniella pini CBS 10737]OCF52734.1 hypothetical protein I206_00030 [Kwoniella pini CBS 10737]
MDSGKCCTAKYETRTSRDRKGHEVGKEFRYAGIEPKSEMTSWRRLEVNETENDDKTSIEEAIQWMDGNAQVVDEGETEFGPKWKKVARYRSNNLSDARLIVDWTNDKTDENFRGVFTFKELREQSERGRSSDWRYLEEALISLGGDDEILNFKNSTGDVSEEDQRAEWAEFVKQMRYRVGYNQKKCEVRPDDPVTLSPRRTLDPDGTDDSSKKVRFDVP